MFGESVHCGQTAWLFVGFPLQRYDSCLHAHCLEIPLIVCVFFFIQLMKTTQQSKTECNSHMCIIHFTSHCAHIATMNRISLRWLLFERFFVQFSCEQRRHAWPPSHFSLSSRSIWAKTKKKLKRKIKHTTTNWNKSIQWIYCFGGVVSAFFTLRLAFSPFQTVVICFMPKISPLLAVVSSISSKWKRTCSPKNAFAKKRNTHKSMLHSISSPYFQISSGLNICPLFNVRCFLTGTPCIAVAFVPNSNTLLQSID